MSEMNQLLALSDLELLVAAYLNECHYPISIKRMVEELEREKDLITAAILNLKINNYVEQIDKDVEENIFWNSEEAHYEINMIKKSDIDKYLAYTFRDNTVCLKGNYVWYATYGTAILYEKFLHYIRGGICQFNHKEYYGCKDQSDPLASREISILYEAYVGSSSPSWNYKGVMFIDTHKPGDTLGRMYLVKAEQYEEIRDQEGRSSAWYDQEVDLGEYLGIPIKTITSKERKVINVASSKYQQVVEAGIKEAYPTKTKEEIKAYLNKTFVYEVEINQFAETLKGEWKKDVLAAKKLSKKERQERLLSIPKRPKKIITTTTFYAYNPVVTAERLALADGKCERCGKEAPFIAALDGTPYLEIHYIEEIAAGGEDTVENTMALCPNCHREIHLGIKI